jgi:hypothetical protein
MPKKTAKTKKPPSTEAVWTVMILMGADTLEGELPLAEFAEQDLTEIESQPLDASILNIVVQLDLPDGARRFYMRSKDKGGRRELTGHDDIPGNQDSSGSEMLENFVTWAKEKYPAQHYMLVVWGHGYRLAFNRDPDDPRGLAFHQLQTVLENTNGDKKLDIIGFDSCNISLIEGAYQLREVADYLVASQFTDPLPGWPYHVVVKKILEVQDTQEDDGHFAGSEGPKDLARAIVSQFVRHYERDKSVTMTALDLNRVGDIADRLGDLAIELASSIENDDAESSAVQEMFQRSQVPLAQPSVDLTTFCWNLLNFSASEQVRIAAATVGDLLLKPTDPFIVAHARSDLLVSMLNGVSILAPNVVDSRDLDVPGLRTQYDALDFARTASWGDLVFSLAERR